MMGFLKAHAPILLALFSVVAAFGGTWPGSKIQASGGFALEPGLTLPRRPG
ncbi:hypothetical protein ACFY04_32495 [Streptomyces sp. NPDC001549]|uniref:hypothetical protein n=1 Tax=Streptomyces sp. NPDC001549 TaxID=3364586 RepID=UPI003681DFA1